MYPQKPILVAEILAFIDYHPELFINNIVNNVSHSDEQNDNSIALHEHYLKIGRNDYTFKEYHPKVYFAVICNHFFKARECLIKAGKNFKQSRQTMLGSDGFGFVEYKGKQVRFPHFGNVIIGDDVSIGSFTAIDRGGLKDTIIGNGVKIDNHVHVAHNVEIGENSLIVAGTVLGGSCKIGKNCFVGMNATIRNKIKVGDNCLIGMGAVVVKDVPDNTTVKGNPAR